MATSMFGRVADLSEEQRKTIELLIGKPLRSDQEVHWMVVSPGTVPTDEDRARARAGLASIAAKVSKNLDEQGLSPEEFGDVVDEAVRHVRGQQID